MIETRKPWHRDCPHTELVEWHHGKHGLFCVDCGRWGDDGTGYVAMSCEEMLEALPGAFGDRFWSLSPVLRDGRRQWAVCADDGEDTETMDDVSIADTPTLALRDAMETVMP
jgi:hypothetical protein